MKRTKKNSEPLPIRSSAQIMEDESKQIFSELINSWMIVNWMQKDFGIDAIIEITKPIAKTKNQTVTGKRISVQLKSSSEYKLKKESFSISIPIEKINYWIQSFEPVILVCLCLKSRCAYYRWIDERLLEELYKKNEKWVAQDSVSIYFRQSSCISPDTLRFIEKYALNWKRPHKSILTPGNYFDCSNQAHQYAEELKEVCQTHNFAFLSSEIDVLCKEVSNSIYTIAIIGLSRGGKSTLINALLHSDISPVGKLPTTGVPITIFPKDENKSFVYFKDGNQTAGNASSEFLSEYTSQDKNPRNKKGVKLVRVHIVNNLLERGFALCDVPGLDDADPSIKTIAKTTIYSSNAIIYVISLAGYNDGEFRINDKNIDDLNELRGRMDRVFLVFNKVDKITRVEDLEQLKKYINETLEYYGILDFLAVPPIYVSALEAHNNRMTNKSGIDSVSQLEQILWEYLINQNRTGIHKLLSNFANNINLIEKLKNIAQTRLQNSSQRESFEAEIKHVKNEVVNLRHFISEKRNAVYDEIKRYVIDRFNNVIEHLTNELNRNSPNLSAKSQVKVFLENEAYKIISDVYEYLQQEIFTLQTDVNQWISKKLKQVEISLSGISQNLEFKMPDISKYTGHVHSFFIENGVDYIGIVETLMSKVIIGIEWLFGKLFYIFTADYKIREREIKKNVRLSQQSYNKMQTELLQNVSKYLTGICNAIEEKTSDRTRVYLGDLQYQVTQLDVPLTSLEKKNIQNLINELIRLAQNVGSYYNHLKDYADGIVALQIKKVS